MPREATDGGSALGTLMILVGIVAALLVTAIGDDEAGPAGSGPANTTGNEESELSLSDLAVKLQPQTARKVEIIRRLQFRKIPEPRVVNSEFLNELTRRELRKPRVAADAVASSIEAKLLGLIEFDDDLTAVATESGDLAAAAYDPRSGRLYVLSDSVGAEPALIEFVLAHELNHALEDQRFGLEDSSVAADDRALAQTSLVEGTATALMTDYATKFLNPLELGASAAGLDPGTEGVPEFVVEQLEFAYLEGSKFVQALYARTDSWLLVNRALRSDPPSSTEQILHPVKYLLGEEPMPVSLGQGLLGKGWVPVDTGAAGEFATTQILEVGDANVEARTAAEGWGGDRYVLLRRRSTPPGDCVESPVCRSHYAIVVAWRWDSARDTEEFTAALPAYLEGGLNADRVTGGWELTDGAAAVSVDGGEVRLALAPTLALARRAAG